MCKPLHNTLWRLKCFLHHLPFDILLALGSASNAILTLIPAAAPPPPPLTFLEKERVEWSKRETVEKWPGPPIPRLPIPPVSPTFCCFSSDEQVAWPFFIATRLHSGTNSPAVFLSGWQVFQHHHRSLNVLSASHLATRTRNRPCLFICPEQGCPEQLTR